MLQEGGLEVAVILSLSLLVRSFTALIKAAKASE